MRIPAISIIMPVYNAEQFLVETIESIQAQTFTNFEMICVDDGSNDRSADILRSAAEKDERFVVLHQKHSGAGAARNVGLENAKGEYTIFLDSHHLFSPLLLEKLYQKIVSNRADIAACNFSRLGAGGNKITQTGIYTAWIPSDAAVFNYRDCPDYIMRVTSPWVWNKLYRTEFIREHNLKFDELFSCNDVTFVAISLAAAERITYVLDPLVCRRSLHSGVSKKLDDVIAAVDSAVSQANQLPHGKIIKNAVLRFVVDNHVTALKKYIKDFTAPDAARFYQVIHKTFNEGDFIDLEPQWLHNNELYREFLTIQKHDYESMKWMIGRRLIVSMTTYPARIGYISQVLETIYAQTRKPDEIVLWLAEEQFPGKLEDIPEDLLRLVDEKRLTIRWCDDLKPHKKYFYAFQEYCDDLIITIDDDLLYPKDMLEALYKSYILFPNAVSALRAHLILVSEENQILPYNDWVHETDTCIHEPSMQLMATGGAGTLYPPELFPKEFFDREVIAQTCLRADDLWLKAMQLLSDVPVVVARPYEPLRFVPDSQDEALNSLNVKQRHNDIQLQQICKWLDEKFGPNCFVQKLTETEIGTKIHGIKSVSRHLNKEREVNRRRKLTAEDKLKATESELKQSENRIREIEKKLRQAEADKAALQALASISGQYHKTGKMLRDLKAAQGPSVSWGCRYVVYRLAWIPEKLLIGMTYYAENGLSASAKRLFRKLFKR